MNTEIKVILPFEKKGEFFVERLGEIEQKPVYDFVKRVFDVAVSFVALLILLIPMLIIGVIIKLSSKGPIFYSQERLGFKGKKINVIKFRTMYVDAEENGAQWSDGEEDERIFPFGKLLRKVRLDELPQFWCILKGERGIIETTEKSIDFSRVVAG